MFITAHNVVPYLIEVGAIQAADVVHDNCKVENASSRNRCFCVRFDRAAGVFVKQSPLNEVGMQDYLRIEAACARHFHSQGLSQRLGIYVCRLLNYDEASGIVATELLPEVETWRTFCLSQPQCRAALAEQLGHALAEFHLPETFKIVEALPASARHRVPSILRDLRSFMLGRDPAGISAAINRYAEYTRLVSEVACVWQADGLMHGDMRWDNVLVESHGNEHRLKLIDWELAGGGDTAWDVAGIVQACLIDWAFHQIELDDLRASVAGFLTSYLGCRRIVDRPAFLTKVIRYAGCRLVQSVLEQHPGGAPLTEHGAQLLQLSWNTLKDPEAVIGELLQLDLAIDCNARSPDDATCIFA